jgi:PIN domain nuclease of toxin-antitoxin system
MNVLLDTCALLALARGELPAASAQALSAADEAVVSTVSAWEIAIKSSAGRLRLTEAPVTWFLGLTERHRLREVHLDSRTACAAAALPALHRDPFDRVIVALAQANALTVITADEDIPRYPGVTTIW